MERNKGKQKGRTGRGYRRNPGCHRIPEGLELGRVQGGVEIGTKGERETSVEGGWGRENQGGGSEEGVGECLRK